MAQGQITLAEMAEVADEESRHAAERADHYRDHLPNAPMFAIHHRRAQVFERMAQLLRILATFEDKARKFVGGLIKEHQG